MAAAVAGAAGDRVPALPRAPAEAAAGRFAEAAAGYFAEAAPGRFAEVATGRFPFPRADGSSQTGCLMLHAITIKQKVWSKNQRIRSSKFAGEVKKQCNRTPPDSKQNALASDPRKYTYRGECLQLF